MPLKLANYESKALLAVKAFWSGRDEARLKQAAAGKADQGERSAVTAGINMNGFISLMEELVRVNGLKSAEIHLTRRVLTLPGFLPPYQALGYDRSGSRHFSGSTGVQIPSGAFLWQQLQ